MRVSKSITPRTRFVFVHIPKTAGSTVLTFFQKVFGPSAVLLHGENWNVADVAQGIPPHVRMVGGHFPLRNVIGSLPDFHYLSVVREPCDRIESYHRFALNEPGHSVRELLPHKEVNADIMESEEFRLHVQNQQTYFLSPDGTARSVVGMVKEGRMSIAGIEEIDAFLRKVVSRMGLPFHDPGIINSSSTSAVALSPETKRILDNITTEDRAIYRFALRAKHR